MGHTHALASESTPTTPRSQMYRSRNDTKETRYETHE